MSSPTEKILQTTDHPIARMIADFVASGKSFGQIMEEYEPKMHPDKAKEIYEFKTRISEKLRDGHSIHHAIDHTFKDPQIKMEILELINNYKEHRRP